MSQIPIEAVPWVIVAVILPSLGGLFWMLRTQGKDIYNRVNANDKAIDKLETKMQAECDNLKLYVAENFASNKNLEAMEKRITAYLLRIEERLERKVSK